VIHLRHTVLFALPILVVAGPYLPIVSLGGFNLFASRAIVLICTVAPFVVRGGTRRPRGPVSTLLAVSTLWVIWGLMSIFWVAGPSGLDGVIRGVAVVTLGGLTSVALWHLKADSDRGLGYLLAGWTAATIGAAAIGFWELATGNHLPGYWVTTQPERVLRLIVIATFGNANNYGAFLVLTTPILLFHLGTRGGGRRLATILLPISFLMAVLTTSRLAVIAVSIVLLAHLFMSHTGRFRTIMLITAVALLGSATLRSVSIDIPLLLEAARVVQTGVSLEGSNLIRLNLSLAGIDMLAESNGVGVGPGGYAELMSGGYSGFETAGFTQPHNWWIEILAEFGVVVFLGFTCTLMAWLARGARALRHEDQRGRLGLLLVTGIVAYGMAGLASSSYLADSTNWLFVGTLAMIGTNLQASRGVYESRRAVSSVAHE